MATSTGSPTPPKKRRQPDTGNYVIVGKESVQGNKERDGSRNYSRPRNPQGGEFNVEHKPVKDDTVGTSQVNTSAGAFANDDPDAITPISPNEPLEEGGLSSIGSQQYADLPENVHEHDRIDDQERSQRAAQVKTGNIAHTVDPQIPPWLYRHVKAQFFERLHPFMNYSLLSSELSTTSTPKGIQALKMGSNSREVKAVKRFLDRVNHDFSFKWPHDALLKIYIYQGFTGKSASSTGKDYTAELSYTKRTVLGEKWTLHRHIFQSTTEDEIDLTLKGVYEHLETESRIHGLIATVHRQAVAGGQSVSGAQHEPERRGKIPEVYEGFKKLKNQMSRIFDKEQPE